MTGRYHRALENVSDARQAYERLTSAAPTHCIEEWIALIESAEANRCTDAAAMDIMHSRIQAGQSLKDIQAAMLKADRLEGLTNTQDGYLDWLLEGLNIEDEQSVSSSMVVSGLNCVPESVSVNKSAMPDPSPRPIKRSISKENARESQLVFAIFIPHRLVFWE